jgi:hypothetical protein
MQLADNFVLMFVSYLCAGANQKSSSHFHCLKCDYYCTDTNKVVAHRRQHQKLDSIMAAGFEKYTPTQAWTTHTVLAFPVLEMDT